MPTPPWNKRRSNYYRFDLAGDIITTGEDFEPVAIEDLVIQINGEYIVLDNFKNAAGDSVAQHILAYFSEQVSEFAKIAEEKWQKDMAESKYSEYGVHHE